MKAAVRRDDAYRRFTFTQTAGSPCPKLRQNLCSESVSRRVVRPIYCELFVGGFCEEGDDGCGWAKMLEVPDCVCPA